MTESLDRLCTALAQVEAHPNRGLEVLGADFAPLSLLLSTPREIVAFAVVDAENPLGSSKLALHAFRRLYALRMSEYRSVEPTLVLCTQGEWERRREFVSRVEVDPYFCRKFVIRMDEELLPQLESLPFAVFDPSVRTSLVLPPAQTVIGTAGLDSRLVRELTQSNVSSPKNVADRILATPVPSTSRIVPTSPATSASVPTGGRPPRTRIKKVQVCNFRAYRKAIELDVDADVIVVYGPNGLGKTSLFDAIDFACTGTIARFADRYSRDSEAVSRLLRHMDSGGQPSFVELLLGDGAKTFRIRRETDHRATAKLDAVDTSRTDILLTLSGLGRRTKDMRIEQLTNLFRATHILGQEYQTLTKDVRDKSSLDEAVVSRMLALQDYVRIASRVDKIVQEMANRAARSTEAIDRLKASQDEAKTILRTYTSEWPRRTSTDVEALVVGPLVIELNAALGTSYRFSAQAGPAEVRRWRAETAGRKASVAAQQSEAESLLRQIGAILRLHSQVIGLRERVASESRDVDSITQDLETLSEQYADCQSRCGEGDSTLARLDEHKDNLEWAVEAARRSRALRSSLRVARTSIKSTTERLQHESKQRDAIERRVSSIAHAFGVLQCQTENADRRVGVLERLLEQLPEWQQREAGAPAMVDELRKLDRQIARTEVHAETLHGRLAAARKAAEILSAEAAQAEQAMERLRTAIDAVLLRDIGTQCPMCGTEHSNADELRSRIRRHLSSADSAIGPRPQALSEAYCEAHRISNGEDRLTRELRARRERRSDLECKLQASRQFAEIYVESAREVGLDAVDECRLAEALAQARRRQASIATKTAILREGSSTLESEASALSFSMDLLNASIAAWELETQQSVAEEDQIASEAIRRGLAEYSTTTSARQALAATHRKLARTKAEHLIVTRERDTLAKQTAVLHARLESHNRRIELLSARLVSHEEKLTAFRLRCDACGAGFPPEEDILRERQQGLAADLARLSRLQDRLIQAETYLDNAQRAAIVEEQQRSLAACRAKLKAEVDTHQQATVWQKALSDIRDTMISSRDNVVTRFCNEYGPLVSKLERRLRVVQGFDGVEIRPDKGGIAIRTHRMGHSQDRVLPSDYFSSSQLQVLSLCLFLTAALGQTWSRFAPILMDDPVVHFDDMNCYALVDLLYALVVSGTGHQFFISTCDHDFFQLAAERLRPLGTKAKFIVFEALGADGPFVRYPDVYPTDDSRD